METAVFGEPVGTWHRWRVSLACKCCKMKLQDGAVQAILAWRTSESVRHYARLAECPKEFASTLDQLVNADVSGVDHDCLPTYDPELVVPQFDEIEVILDTQAKEDRRALRSQEEPLRAADTASTSGVTEPPMAVVPTRKYRVGAPHGTVLAQRTDPKGIIDSNVDVPNNTWPGYEEDTGASICKVLGYVPALPTLAGGGAAYIVRNGKYSYAIPASVLDQDNTYGVSGGSDDNGRGDVNTAPETDQRLPGSDPSAANPPAATSREGRSRVRKKPDSFVPSMQPDRCRKSPR